MAYKVVATLWHGAQSNLARKCLIALSSNNLGYQVVWSWTLNSWYGESSWVQHTEYSVRSPTVAVLGNSTPTTPYIPMPAILSVQAWNDSYGVEV